MFLGTKSDIVKCLSSAKNAERAVESMTQVNNEQQPNQDQHNIISQAPVVEATILDAAAVINIKKPDSMNVKSFQDYAEKVFIPYVDSQQGNRIDIVWDQYIPNSLKSYARESRGKGIRRRVTAQSKIPSDWQNFLKVEGNKKELFPCLAETTVRASSKTIFTNIGNRVITNTTDFDISSMDPCNHEEADTRIFTHVKHISTCGYNSAIIRTVDSDIVVLAVSLFDDLGLETLWIAFNTGIHFSYIPVHEIAACLGIKCKGLPFFHALTGCDTTSAFQFKGKCTAWDTWKTFPEVTSAFIDLSSNPDSISAESMQSIERFVILLYDRTSNETDVNMVRKRLFSAGRDMERIPPTKVALEEHVKRAVYQGGKCWGQCLEPMQNLPSPSEWGWQDVNGIWSPLWSQKAEAMKSLLMLTSCGCKTGCQTKRCKCRKTSLSCTALCKCNGVCN